MSLELTAAPDRAKDRGDLRTPVIVAVLVAATAALHLSWTLPSDTSWLLTVCERMLAGQKLYAEIGEPNPPMSAWLYLPWVWFASKSGASPELVTVCAVIAICVAMIAVSGWILKASGVFRDARTWLIVATLALVVAPIMTFSQREHFAVAFAFPMLATIAARAAGRPVPFWAVVVAGLCGGLTIAVKPHFGFAIALPVLYAAIARRSLRPIFALECLLTGATLIIYLGIFWSIYPEYFSEMLPIVTTIYLPNRNPLLAVLTQTYALVAYVCVFAWLKTSGFREQALSRVLLAAVGGFFIAYLLPGRGWVYHMLPTVTLTMIGLGLSLFARGASSSAKPGASAVSPIGKLAVGVALFVTGLAAYERATVDLPFVRDVEQALKAAGPNPKIAMIADDLAVGSPIHRLVGGTLVNRGPSLWMAANAFALCRNEVGTELRRTCDEVALKERAVLSEDLQRNPPDVLLVNTKSFDWLEWAREDPAIARITAPFKLHAVIEYGTFRAEVMLPERALDLGLRTSIEAGR